jgi:hypothetical protein
MSPLRRTVLVALLAVFGIALAAVITWATSQLVRQRIGLASQPLSAGRHLLPPGARSTAPTLTSQGAATTTTPNPRSGQSSSTQSSTTPAPSSTTSAPSNTTPSTTPAPSSTTTRSAPAQPSPTGSGEEAGTRSKRRSGADGGDSSSRRDD